MRFHYLSPSKIRHLFGELSAQGHRISRRDILKLSSAFLATAPALSKTFESTVLPQPTLQVTADQVLLSFGTTRWLVDRRWFAGRPRIIADQEGDRIQIQLRNAVVPGTDFSLDFDARITPVGNRFGITLQFANGWVFRGDLQQWLSGTPLHCSSAPLPVLHLGEKATVAAKGTIDLWFSKDWTFIGTAASEILLTTPVLRATFRKLTLQVGDLPTSIFQQPPTQRAVWIADAIDAARSTLSIPNTRWTFRNFPFQRLRIETATTRNRAARWAIGGIAAEEAEVIAASDPAIRLWLDHLTIGCAGTSSRHECWISGDFSDKRRWWIHLPPMSFELGGGAETRPFELRVVNDTPIVSAGSPKLHRFHLAMADAVTEPAAPLFPLTVQIAEQGRQQRRAVRGTKLPTITLGPVVRGDPGSTLSFVVLRPEDLLYLRFDFLNVQLRGTTLLLNSQSRMIVTFAPQSIAERAYYESGSPATSERPEMPPIPARLSGTSRLVFRFPATIRSLPLQLPKLLEWNKFIPVVAKNALPPDLADATETAFHLVGIASALTMSAKLWRRALPQPTQQQRSALQPSKPQQQRPSPMPRMRPATVVQKFRRETLRFTAPKAQPALNFSILSVQDFVQPPPAAPAKPQPLKATETAIELPYRLFLSPHRFAAWAHRTALPPASEHFSVELWHTRLGVRAKDGSFDEGNAPLRTVRAIWSWDVTSPRPDPNDLWPFRTSLTRNDRYQIVHLSSNFIISNYTPQPIRVAKLFLSALGGWLDSQAAWEPPAGFSVEEWLHRATLGRDHFVRVVYAGFLFPFGHRASLVKITERKFRRTPRGQMAAYLIQKQFIIVRQPVKIFPASGLPGQRYEGRKFPFRRVELRTLITPPLDKPETTGIDGLGNQAFWPRVGGKDVLFSVVATDWEGKEVEFVLPLIFIQSTANQRSTLLTVQNAYHSGTSWRTVDLAGQSVAYAPPARAGDTRFETAAMRFNVFIPDPGAAIDTAKEPYFYPEMEQADIRIQQVEALLGTGATTTVELFGENSRGFLPAGFDPAGNAGEVFLKLRNPVQLNFSQNTDKAGGLAAPNLKIQAISRGVGPVGANSPFDDFLNGTFDPSKFFDQVFEATIVGSVKLKHILRILTFVAMAASEADKIPKLIQKTVYDFVEDIDQIKSDIEDRFESVINTIEALPGAVSSAVQTAINEVKGALNDVKNFANTIWTTFQTTINDLGTRNIAELIELLKKRTDATSKQLQQQLEELQRRKERVEEKINELRALVEQEIKAAKQLEKEIRQKYEKWKQFIDDIRKGLSLEYKWETDKLQSWPSGNPLFETFDTSNRKTRLSLKTSAHQPWKPEPPTIKIQGELQDFAVHLIAGIMEFLAVDFTRLRLRSKNFEKVKVDVDIANVEFKGPLSFVSKLQDLIPKGGFGDYLPKIELLKNPGLLVYYKLGLPSISVGVLSIQNLSLFFSLKIPFISEPVTLRFGFCERHDPFRLTVYIFGGGGFFALELTPAGVTLLEAAFEFGGSFAFSVAVAQGSVGAMVGIYFRMVFQNGGNIATLEGYFRMWGELRVLGIISISAVLYMSLTWQSNGKVYGQASLVVEVNVLFFSKSVSIKVERQFKGSSGDPTFAQMFPTPEPWKQYCLAFA